MAKSSTTTGSDALYVTDDLEGRLDEESLTEPVEAINVSTRSPDPSLVFDSEFPETDPELEAEEAIVEPEKLKALITFVAEGVCKCVDGTLQAFSFGKGWLCALEGVDEDQALEAAAHFGAHKDALVVEVHVKGRQIQFTGNLDFTISFGYGVTFTVTADEGHYISV